MHSNRCLFSFVITNFCGFMLHFSINDCVSAHNRPSTHNVPRLISLLFLSITKNSNLIAAVILVSYCSGEDGSLFFIDRLTWRNSKEVWWAVKNDFLQALIVVEFFMKPYPSSGSSVCKKDWFTSSVQTPASLIFAVNNTCLVDRRCTACQESFEVFTCRSL